MSGGNPPTKTFLENLSELFGSQLLIIGPITEFVPLWLLGDELRVEPDTNPKGVDTEDGPELFPPELEPTSPNTLPAVWPCRLS